MVDTDFTIKLGYPISVRLVIFHRAPAVSTDFSYRVPFSFHVSFGLFFGADGSSVSGRPSCVYGGGRRHNGTTTGNVGRVSFFLYRGGFKGKFHNWVYRVGRGEGVVKTVFGYIWGRGSGGRH